MSDDEDNGVPCLESDDEDQENINGAPDLGVQDDGIIGMHNINLNIIVFPDEVIQINKQTGQMAHLLNRPMEPTEPQ